MDTIEIRKKEISSIYLAVSGINDEKEKNIVSTYSFPRLYGHFEKFLESAFLEIIDSILKDEDTKLRELKGNFGYFFIYIMIHDLGEKAYFNHHSNKNLDLKISDLDKIKIRNYIKELSVATSFNKLINFLKYEDSELEETLKKLEIKIGMIKKKYKARCDIAHGHLIDLETLVFEDFEDIKKKIDETLDLIKYYFSKYLEYECYK